MVCDVCRRPRNNVVVARCHRVGGGLSSERVDVHHDPPPPRPRAQRVDVVVAKGVSQHATRRSATFVVAAAAAPRRAASNQLSVPPSNPGRRVVPLLEVLPQRRCHAFLTRRPNRVRAQDNAFGFARQAASAGRRTWAIVRSLGVGCRVDLARDMCWRPRDDLVVARRHCVGCGLPRSRFVARIVVALTP